MDHIKRMLLATHDGCRSHHGELRAVLLASRLGLEAFDLLTLRRTSAPFGRAFTESSHVEVRGSALSAWIGALRQPLGLPCDARAIDPIWTSARGGAAATVVALARRCAADLTVLAPRRRNVLLEWLAPSGQREILRRSRNSLLLVRAEPRDVYRKVLVAVDFSAEAHAAARVARALAPDAHFTFVHAYRLPDERLMRELDLPGPLIGAHLARGCQAAWERLEGWIEAIGPERRRTGAVHSGFPVAVIKACARTIGADLIVVGRQGTTGADRHGLGDVARRLAGQAACDVLIGPAMPGTPSARGAAARLASEAQEAGAPG